MNKREYSLSVGVILVAAALLFFMMPVLFPIDAFIPVMLAILSFLIGVSFFFMGISEK